MTDQPPGNYPPPGGYPPPPGNYPPPGGYPPPPGNYPAPGGYPPPPASYPAPGGYPPPPASYPAPGGYPPPPAGNFPPPVPGYGPVPTAVGNLPQDAYTPWLSRVGAYLVDSIPIIVGSLLVAVISGPPDSTGSTDSAVFVSMLFQLVVLGYVVWNFGYRQGTTGSSLGKSVLKFKVVSEATGQPIGFGMSVVRQLAHILDGLALGIGYLFPLWDAKRQTFADKIISTVCLPTT